jgi:hypothetical protein
MSTLKNTSESRAAYSNTEAAANVGGVYNLVHAAVGRYRQLRDKHHRKVITTAGNKITALQEIEAGEFYLGREWKQW